MTNASALSEKKPPLVRENSFLKENCELNFKSVLLLHKERRFLINYLFFAYDKQLM